MADGEDGYGGPEKVIDTIKKFIQTGVAGINLEDQILDRKTKVSVINEDLMTQKIMFARETAEVEGNPNFIINARTDALRSTEDRSEGLKIAISRANQYIESGADIAFITYVETMDEVKVISREVKGPISIAAGMPYNIENFSINDLKKQGIARISLPTLLILSSLSAIRKSLKSINEDNMLKTPTNEFLYPIQDLNSLLKK
jgi:2-methylisocitrate lyase-like PEP mutase family enzyme